MTADLVQTALLALLCAPIPGMLLAWLGYRLWLWMGGGA